jgi:hypothetical protein
MQPARETDAVRPVAQVSLHLSGDGGHGERGEFLAQLRVEALDRVQETDGSRLDEVVMLGAASLVAVSQSLDKGHVELDQAFLGACVTLFAIRAEKSACSRVSVVPSLPCRSPHPGGNGGVGR